MKDSTKLLKRVSVVGIGLCAMCCLMPIVTVVFSVGTLALVSTYVEWFVFLIIVLVVGVFVLYYILRNHARSCDIDCVSREDKGNV